MARILTVTEETAQEAQRPLVERFKKKVGKLLGIHQVFLPDPQMATLGGQLYAHLNLRPDSPFTRLQRELLATLVYGLISETSCSCLGIHTEAVRRLTQDTSFGADFVHTWPTYDLHSKTRALLAYATRLTQASGRIEDADIDELRAAGWAAAGLTPDQIPADVVFPEAIPDQEEEPIGRVQGTEGVARK